MLRCNTLDKHFVSGPNDQINPLRFVELKLTSERARGGYNKTATRFHIRVLG